MATSFSAKEEFDVRELLQEAKIRWLRPAEVLFILRNYQNFKLSSDAPIKPQGGSLFLFDRKILRFFRKDGHNWRKKKDGKTVQEAHERLKAGNMDALHCYYAHGEDNHNFQRRSYWMLEEAYEHIVLVHYREVTEGKFTTAPVPDFTREGLLSSENQQFVSSKVRTSTSTTETVASYIPPWISYSPMSAEEASSIIVTENDELDSVDDIEKIEDFCNSSGPGVAPFTPEQISLLEQRTQELQLELEGSLYTSKPLSPWSVSSTVPLESKLSLFENALSKQEILAPQLLDSVCQKQYQEGRGSLANSNNLNIDSLLQNPDAYLGMQRQCALPNGESQGLQEASQAWQSSSPSWKEMLALCTTSTYDTTESNINVFSRSDITELSLVGALVDTLSTKPQMAKFEASSEESDLVKVKIKDEQLFPSVDPKNKWNQATSIWQGQWPQERANEEKSHELGRLYESNGYNQSSASTRYSAAGASSPALSLTTTSCHPEHESHDLDLDLATKKSSTCKMESNEKFGKSDSFGWLEGEEICADKNNILPIGKSDYYGISLEQQSNVGVQPLEMESTVTLAQIQRFSIRDFSPDWAYSTEGAKVLITGDFVQDPLDLPWFCMVGNVEVPVDVIQKGVLCCRFPPHAPGIISLCITCGDRIACSEIRDFEYRAKPIGDVSETESSLRDSKRTREELLLQVRFARMLLSQVNCSSKLGSMQKEEGAGFTDEISWLEAVSDDQWEQIERAADGGDQSSAYTKEWLLQMFLKDKLNHWLLCKSSKGEHGTSELDEHGLGVLHMAGALGYEWALSPTLNAGVGINFRDVHGWTALHWAAHYGREKVVAALVAAGASTGAVTDPTQKYLAGRTAADLAAASGHGGIAGYLAEAALTSHLSSLTLGENEISKASGVVEADRAVEGVSERSSIQQSTNSTEDQLSLKDSLAAVRNAAQAAARIQAAFRAQSFKRRQEKAQGSCDEYGMTMADLEVVAAARKIQKAFRGHRDQKLNTAAICIQRKYRGWKGRKEYLTLRQHVVKIQAHVRGHQTRKKYKPILWSVGILDKAILRWRRKGAGLRGFRAEIPEGIEEDEENNDDDFLKVFRKQKVDIALDEAVTRVLHMVDSPEARHQYRRMLDSYQQVKAEYHGHTSEASLIPQSGFADVEEEYTSPME